MALRGLVGSASRGARPQTIGVFGGSFNPIHLGHALLAITTQQTKPVDAVVLVPVFKHHVKTDLLPFEDRVAMCELAIAPYRGDNGNGVQVSTIEREVGESNAAMLRALKQQYPEGSKLLWICGDDVFDWIENPKGLETMREVSGLIVQRRLHKGGANRFFKAPLDERRIRAISVRLNLEIDFIYGELPHFSSTLVRRAPGTWQSFLPQDVAKYLSARPALLAQLRANLDADADAEDAKAEPESNERHAKHRRIDTGLDSRGLSAACVMRGLGVVHALQRERGHTGLRLSMGTKAAAKLREAQESTDALLREALEAHAEEHEFSGFEEAFALAAELEQIPVWLARDRGVVERSAAALASLDDDGGWAGRCALLDKFNCRIDVLMGACTRAFAEIAKAAEGLADEEASLLMRGLPELLLQWSEGKEALGRLRAYVCAGGPTAPSVVRSSLKMRQRLHDIIEHKERRIDRVLCLQADLAPAGARLAAPDALHHMLERVTAWEWTLMGCFASSTPLPLVHRLLAGAAHTENANEPFDVEKFFSTTSAAIDLMFNIVKVVAASGCARA